MKQYHNRMFASSGKPRLGGEIWPKQAVFRPKQAATGRTGGSFVRIEAGSRRIGVARGRVACLWMDDGRGMIICSCIHIVSDNLTARLSQFSRIVWFRTSGLPRGRHISDLSWEFRLAFRTDLSQGQDAKEDEDVAYGSSSRLAQSDPIPSNQIPGTNAALAFSSSGLVYSINDNNGHLFTGRLKRDFGLNHQWVRTDPAADTEDIALVAPKTTDLLTLSPASVPLGLRLDPIEMGSGVKAAFSSAAFILRAFSADILQIDPDELDISHLRRRDLGASNFVGEIVISDSLPNGSGFTAWIAENMAKCLEAIIRPPSSESFPAALVEQTHRARCEGACYDCLMNFRNMRYHGLLDWRLGLSLIRVLLDRSYLCGLNGSFDDEGSPELWGWLSTARARRDGFCQAFDAARPADFGQLPGFVVGRFAVLLFHSLWATGGLAHGLAADAISEAVDHVGADSVRVVDLFNLQRRPSPSSPGIRRISALGALRRVDYSQKHTPFRLINFWYS